LAKANYQYEKRRKELAKKKKREEKRQRKIDKGNKQPTWDPNQSRDEAKNADGRR
jgi:hypothetical protein